MSAGETPAGSEDGHRAPRTSLFPIFGRRERFIDACVHAVGMVASVVAVPALIIVALVNDGDALTLVSLGLYAAGLMAMLWASALYHLARNPTRKEALRRVDHAAIFVMIAGTYTPFTLVGVGGWVGIALCAFVWSVAIAGVVIKLRFPRRYEAAAIAAYLGLGWVAVVAIVPIFQALATPVLILLAAGGVTYSVGVLFYVAKRLPCSVAIWHLFVLVAAGLHYAAVLKGIAGEGAA